MMPIMSFASLENNSVKNRIEAAQLTSELEILEKEKRNELRMTANEKQRFKVKYMKGSQQGSDVKMYETHIPGFCFKRNGDHRVQQTSSENTNIDFKDLHFLLFTNGEVDIDKLVCLHLLSFHEMNHLSPPKVIRTVTHCYRKKDSPIEQLLERSQECSNKINDFTTLPTFVLDVYNQSKTGNLNNLKLTKCLLVNVKILDLIHTVVTTLQVANPTKLDQLIDIASDLSAIKRIFIKPKIQDFLLSLRESLLLHRRESFLLTGPLTTPVDHIEIKTATGALEELINSIRANVLQLNNKNLFIKTSNEELINVSNNSSISSTLDNEAKGETRKSGREHRTSNISTRTILEPNAPDELNDSNASDWEVSKFHRNSTNFVRKNIDAISNFQAKEPKLNPASNFKLMRPPSSKKNSFEPIQEEKVEEEDENIPPICTDKSHVRVHLKQTTCLACMEKWRRQLPTPKVASISRSSSDSMKMAIDQEGNVHHKLTSQIYDEEYQLNAYDKKYSSNEVTISSIKAARKPANKTKEKSIDSIKQQYSMNYDFDIYLLERIRQEIREKEKQKRLEKFLQN